MGRDSYRVYAPARLSGQETENAKASSAAAAAASRGQRGGPKRGPPGSSKAMPVPTQAPTITIDARGKMNESMALGIKTVGRANAMAAGRYVPRRSRIGLISASGHKESDG